MNQTALSLIEKQLSQKLPQEWLVCQSFQTTCHGPALLIRVESESQANTDRRLLCLIRLEETNREIIITVPNITSPQIQKVTRAVRKIIRSSDVYSDYCLTLTECQLACEQCSQADQFYKE